MNKVVVVGANGQLGMTVKELVHKYPQLHFDFKTFEELDITNTEHLIKTISKGYDYCINCAAYTNVEDAERHPEQAYIINAQSVLTLAEICKKWNVVLIHISTDYVFDGKKGAPYNTYDTPNPINEYGKSKLQGELYVKQTFSRYYIVRTSWLYSKKHGRNFYKTILDKAKKGEKLMVTDVQIGCPTSTVSLAIFLIEKLILAESPFGLYHFSDQKAMTWFGFATKILKENNLYDKVNLEAIDPQNTLAKRPEYSILKQNST